jgi:thymidylate kinase
MSMTSPAAGFFITFEGLDGCGKTLARAEPARFRVIDATASIQEVAQAVWKALSPILSD